MEKYFVTYNQALALKELGFDEPCFAFYYDKTKFLSLGQKPEYLVDKRKASYIFGNEKHDVTLAPLKSQVFEFFRDKYKYYFWIEPCSQHKIFHFNITCSPSSFTYCTIDETKPNAGGFKSYVEAELACIDKLIEIVKNR